MSPIWSTSVNFPLYQNLQQHFRPDNFFASNHLFPFWNQRTSKHTRNAQAHHGSPHKHTTIAKHMHTYKLSSSLSCLHQSERIFLINEESIYHKFCYTTTLKLLRTHPNNSPVLHSQFNQKLALANTQALFCCWNEHTLEEMKTNNNNTCTEHLQLLHRA